MGLLSAWMVSLGIVSWDQVKAKHLPVPGSLVGVSIVFAFLGLVGEWNSRVAAVAGWGLVVAQAISIASGKVPTLASTTAATGGSQQTAAGQPSSSLLNVAGSAAQDVATGGLSGFLCDYIHICI